MKDEKKAVEGDKKQDNYDQYLERQLASKDDDQGELSDTEFNIDNGPIRIFENRIIGQYKTNNR